MNDSPLFREEAAKAQQPKWMGNIVMVRPLSATICCVFAAAMAAVVIGFGIFGSYTKRSTVSGHLIPERGVLKVYPPQAGVVTQKYVNEGQLVKKGQLLYVISSERQNTLGDVQAGISRELELRQQSLQKELVQTRSLQQKERSALISTIDNLSMEQSNIKAQLIGQRERVALTEAALQRSSALLAQGFYSPEMLQQKKIEFLEQHSRLQILERELIGIDAKLTAHDNELSSLPTRQLNQLANVERMLSAASQEWTESEGKRTSEIRAPESGTATAVALEVGQTTNNGVMPALTIIPVNTKLKAQFYAPSRAVGFINTGDKVMLRYHSFPYQKFGYSIGRVDSVSRTTLTPNELANAPNGVVSSAEPMYQITVELVYQTVQAYGKPCKLQAGMLVDADILQDKRQLYEWVMEPMLSLSGKI